jgi:hypothetical protein
VPQIHWHAAKAVSQRNLRHRTPAHADEQVWAWRADSLNSWTLTVPV